MKVPTLQNSNNNAGPTVTANSINLSIHITDVVNFTPPEQTMPSDEQAPSAINIRVVADKSFHNVVVFVEQVFIGWVEVNV